jgi:hypothetical protein
VRHYFFDTGNDSLLAFFEFPKGKEPAGNRNAIGAMQHCAFVVTAERLREVETRLKSHGIDYIGPIAQLPGLLGIYFYDPNGIRLEFACQPKDGEAPEVIPCVTQTKAEARDEPALAGCGMKRARRREREVLADGCCNETTRIVIASNPVSGAGGRAARCAAARKDLDNDHVAATARVWRAMIGGEVRIGCVVRCRRINRRQRGGDQLLGADDIGLAAGAGQQPVMADETLSVERGAGSA